MATQLDNTRVAPTLNTTHGAPQFVGTTNYTLWLDVGDDRQVCMAKWDGSFSYADSPQTTGSDGIKSLAMWSDGTIIHCVAMSMTGSQWNISLDYIPYTISSDTFGTWTSIEADLASGQNGASFIIGIAGRSDGDLIIVANGLRFNQKGSNYRRAFYWLEEGAGWGAAQALDDGGTIQYSAGAICMGANDLAHIVYMDESNNNLFHKSLSSGNSLSAAEIVNDNAVVNALQSVFVQPVYYDDGGVERITVGWGRDSNRFMYSSEIEDDGTPGAEEQASDTDPYIPSFAFMDFAIDAANKRVYALFVNAADRDLYMDVNEDSGGWGTDIEILDVTADLDDTKVGYDSDTLHIFYKETTDADVFYETYSLTVDQTVPMGAATLASSPQGLNVTIAQTVVMTAIVALSDSTATTIQEDNVTRRHHAESILNVAGAQPDWIDNLGFTPNLISGRAFSKPDGYIRATLSSEASDEVDYTGFGFTSAQVPTNAQIDGIQALVSRQGSNGNLRDNTLQLLKAGVPVGDDQAVTVIPWATIWETFGYGAESDDWSAGLTPTDLYDPDFGLRFSAQAVGGSGDARWDSVTIRIWWSLAPAVVNMSAATLVSSAQSLTLKTDQTIVMWPEYLRSKVQRMMGPAVEGYVTGYHLPTTAANVTRSGSAEVWINPDDALTSDEDWPFSFITDPEYTDYLRLTNFGFTGSEIPVGATIRGIELLMERAGVQSGNVQDSVISVSLSGSVIGDNKAEAEGWLNIFELKYRPSSGAPADDWGAGLDRADVLDSTFGIVISAEAIGGSGDQNPYVDCVWVRIYYAEAQTVAMGAATLASSAQALTVSIAGVAQIVPMSAATLVSSAQTLDVLPGAITVGLGAVTLASSPQALVVSLTTFIEATAATLASSPESLDVIPGSITVTMVAATLASSAQALDVIPGVVAVRMLVIFPLASLPQDLIVVAGAVTVPMSATTLASSAQGLLVIIDILMDAATLASSPQALTVLAAGAPQTVSMSAATLVSAAQALNVAVDEIIGMGDVTLASSAQPLIVVAGIVVIPTTAITLASSAQDLRVETAQIVLMSAATLASSPQTLIVLAAGTPQTISMVVTTLIGSAQTLNVAVDQTVVMGYATLASSAQGLNILAGAATVSMGAATLVSSPQGLSIIAGSISVSLSAATLVSSPQALIAVGEQLAFMSAATLVSSAQGLNVAVDQIIFMGSATLVSSAQTATISLGAVSIQINMGAVTLASSPQTLVLLIGSVTISLEAVTLVSTVTSLAVIPGAVTISASSVSLVSSAEGLNIISIVSVIMGTVTLVSDAQALSLIIGTAFIQMTPATLVSQALPFNAFTDQIIASMIFALFTTRKAEMELRQRGIDFDLL